MGRRHAPAQVPALAELNSMLSAKYIAAVERQRQQYLGYGGIAGHPV